MKTVKLIARIISAPIILVSMFLIDISISLIRIWLFVKNGGELIAYRKDEHKSINDIYNLLKKQQQ